MSKQTFVMLCGLPASGKSTYAKQLAEEMDAIICSSDAIREEMFGNENSQNNNEEVFRVLHSRVKSNLNLGNNVIYDACNINSKHRRAFLMELRKVQCIKKCIIMATPFEMCVNQNESRNRVVPYEVIKRMYLNWNTPYWFEGWNKIEVNFPEGYSIKNTIGGWLEKYKDFNQYNPYHSYTLGKHCKVVGLEMKDNLLLKYAGYLHDIGKPFTKCFINSKGEETDVAHYYQHHCVGSYDSLFFKYQGNVDRLDVSILVNLHMYPYFWENDKKHGEKTRRKYQKLWGDELYNNVMRLYEADKKAH